MQQIHHEAGYLFSSDKARLQPDVIHQYLSEEAYWSKKIPLQTVLTAIEHSFCIGIYTDDGLQVGFARIVTDYATFGYLADVFVKTEHRGKGLSKLLMKLITELPWIRGLRRFTLATVDAHGLYRQFGFQDPAHPERLLEIVRPGMYEHAQEK